MSGVRLARRGVMASRPPRKAFRTAVLSDNPLFYGRMNELACPADRRTRIVLADQTGSNPGEYVGGNWLAEALANDPIAAWLLSDGLGSDVLVDQVGTLTPNLCPVPLDSSSIEGWSTETGPYVPSAGALLGVDNAVGSIPFGGFAAKFATSAAAAGATLLVPGTFRRGVTYTISLYMRGNAGGEVTQVFFGDPTAIDFRYADNIVLTDLFVRYAVSWTPTADYSGAAATIRASSGESFPIAFWANAVQIEEGSIPTAYHRGTGGNPGEYVGSQTPNMCGNPLTGDSTDGWNPNVTTIEPDDSPSGIPYGAYATKVTTPGASVDEGPWYEFAAGTFKAGKTYTVSLYLAAETGGTLLNVQAAIPGVLQAGVVDVTPTNVFERYSFTFMMPSGYDSQPVVIQPYTQIAEAITYWINAVQVTETPAPVPYADTQGVTLGPANLCGTPLTADSVSGWATGATGAGATIEPDNTPPNIPFGSYAGKIITTDVNATEDAYFVVPGIFRAGKTYTVSVYLMGNAGGELIYLRLQGGGGSPDSDAGQISFNLTADWQRYDLQWTPSADESDAAVRFMTGAPSAYIYWGNAVQVTETPEAVPYSEMPVGPLADNTDTGAVFDGIGVSIPSDTLRGHASIPDAPELRLTPPFTIRAWIRPTSIAGWPMIVQKGPGGEEYGLRLEDGSGKLNFNYGTTFAAARDTTVIATDASTRVGVTYDGATVIYYVNGVASSSSALIGTPNPTSEPLLIGSRNDGYGFPGAIFGVDFTPSVLTPNEMLLDCVAGMQTAIDFDVTGALAGGGDDDAAVSWQQGYGRIPDPVDLNTLTEAWSAETLFTTSEDPPGIALITPEYVPSLGNPLNICLGWIAGEPYLSVGFYTGSGWYVAYVTSFGNDGEKHHLVGTWDGTTLLLYLDGVQVAESTPGVACVASPGRDFLLARTWDDGGGLSLYTIMQDEAAIYGHVLSPERVMAHCVAAGIG